MRPQAEPAGSFARPPATASALAAIAAAAAFRACPAGLVPALFLQLRRREDLTGGGQLTRPTAQQVIGQVMVNQTRDPPYRLLRRADVEPRALVPRAAQRLQHPLRAARRPLPDRGERITPGQRAAIAVAITHARLNRTPRRFRGSGSC